MLTEIKFVAEEPEDVETIARMLGVNNVYGALSEIRDEIFRPARNHGYPDAKLSCLLGEAVPEAEADARYEIIDLLEQKFFDILNRRGVLLD